MLITTSSREAPGFSYGVFDGWAHSKHKMQGQWMSTISRQEEPSWYGERTFGSGE